MVFTFVSYLLNTEALNPFPLAGSLKRDEILIFFSHFVKSFYCAIGLTIRRLSKTKVDHQQVVTKHIYLTHLVWKRNMTADLPDLHPFVPESTHDVDFSKCTLLNTRAWSSCPFCFNFPQMRGSIMYSFSSSFFFQC